MTTLFVIIGYLCLLLALGFFSNRLFRGTSKDYFVASHSIGPFLLLMSVFGTTMTAFALVGSTGKSFERGIGTYGLMASISGLVHAAIFFLIGIRLWAFGKNMDSLPKFNSSVLVLNPTPSATTFSNIGTFGYSLSSDWNYWSR